MTDEKSVLDEQPDVKPLDVDGVSAAIAGTAIFAVGLLVMIVLRSELAARGTQWWLWVCVVGIIIGLLFTGYSIRRRTTYRAARAATDKE